MMWIISLQEADNGSQKQTKMDIFGAYTVGSYWQMYNKDLSAVFRETNHAPEVWAKFHNNWFF